MRLIAKKMKDTIKDIFSKDTVIKVTNTEAYNDSKIHVTVNYTIDKESKLSLSFVMQVPQLQNSVNMDRLSGSSLLIEC